MRKEVIGNHTLYLGDCLDILPEISRLDAVITDPPYGVLKHEIETDININLILENLNFTLKEQSFICVFGLVPNIFYWYQEAIKNNFKFKDHIVWVKRWITSIYLPIVRQKEDLFIFSKGGKKYLDTKGDYGDIKPPLYLDGLLKIEALKREVSYLKRQSNGHLRNMESSKIFNDQIYSNYKSSKEYTLSWDRCNITNVWSFAPHNRIKYKDEDYNIKHPTVKPIALLDRLLKLTSDIGDTVVDPFMGSGTTGVACENLGRKFIGIEISEKYFDIACKRVEQATKSPKSKDELTDRLREKGL